MYVAFWIGWSLIGLAFTVGVFAWALRNRQLTQSRKAALIPFDDIAPEDPPGGVRPRSGRGSLVLAVIAGIIGLAGAVAVLVFAIMTIQ